MDSDVKRTFPFITGDRIRLHNWPEDKHIRLTGNGRVHLIGEFPDGYEGTWYKDAQTAYNDYWELYAPTPQAQTVYVTYNETGDFNDGQRVYTTPLSPHNLDHGETCWLATLTPTERIHP